MIAMSQAKKVILITGVSSGIGLISAEYLSVQGHTVYGIGRNAEYKNAHFHYASIDVNNEIELQKFIQFILEKENRIDVLINNAGIHILGSIEHIPHHAVLEVFNSNLFGALHAIRMVLPSMKKENSGLIICISSIGGICGLPFQGIYCASKFAIEGICESLRMEVSKSNINVVLVEPGDFNTPITKNRKVDSNTLHDTFYEKQFVSTKYKVELDESSGMKPIHLAYLIEKIMSKKNPALRYTAGKILQRIVPFLKRMLPSSLFEYIIKTNYYS